jgi:hypothetical protein
MASLTDHLSASEHKGRIDKIKKCLTMALAFRMAKYDGEQILGKHVRALHLLGALAEGLPKGPPARPLKLPEQVAGHGGAARKGPPSSTESPSL